jgi:uncharacterized membrane protein
VDSRALPAAKIEIEIVMKARTSMNIGIIIGLVIIGVSIPLIFNKVKPNPWYGFRTPKTLSSPDIWYKANRYMGKDMFVAGIVITTVYILLPIIRPQLTLIQGLILFYLMLTVPVAIAIIRGLRYLKKL